MTAAHLRRTLRSLRVQQAWTYAELAADIQRVLGAAIVSTNTVRTFVAGAKVTPRIETAIRTYVERRESAPVAQAS